jgi:hypothetical protein
MKTFKQFAQIDELKSALPKAGSEKKFVQSTYLAQIKDPGDLEKVGPEEEGPHDTKKGAGKRQADRLDNKQAFGEAVSNSLIKRGAELDKKVKKIQSSMDNRTTGRNHDDAVKRINAGYDKRRQSKNEEHIPTEEEIVSEADFSKQQTKMAHTIGKEFAKKKVGDGSKDAAYAIATAMVRDKPDSAKKAYSTIKAKTQNEEHQDALMALFDELNETNQQAFLHKLESQADKLIEFALSRHEG